MKEASKIIVPANLCPDLVSTYHDEPEKNSCKLQDILHTYACSHQSDINSVIHNAMNFPILIVDIISLANGKCAQVPLHDIMCQINKKISIFALLHALIHSHNYKAALNALNRICDKFLINKSATNCSEVSTDLNCNGEQWMHINRKTALANFDCLICWMHDPDDETKSFLIKASHDIFGLVLVWNLRPGSTTAPTASKPSGYATPYSPTSTMPLPWLPRLL